MSIRKRPVPNHSWSGIKITTSSSKAINGTNRRLKKGKKEHGFVTRNHSSTIVRERKTRDGKVAYDYVGETHDLPKAKQAAIAKALDNPNVSKVVIYDQD